ncbi:Gamma-glutamyl cyclotransferase, AIG2-like [Actinomadura madurae]|uniref:Putative gamma-glutamylcyclotransferase n=1 Tax=Actinomadura madurae TaxID=1993 RepID=A0A1I5SSF0_9ACTN|nr:gamma-glutamylcyclotransferase family protein [Actinomadura madurae]SFP73655.1 Gamma-glutamyl cyclotransferase, AIG2-like [Actinomadura madurae]
MDPEALFVYGSLQFPEVLFALIDRVPDHEPVAAEGWRVTTLPGRVYPGLVPARTTATGYLLTGLTPQEWQVLDAFEDPVYELVRVDLADGRHGWTYACNEGADVGPDDWSPEHFETQHLPAYVIRCEAWRRRYEASEQVS